jgi:uracil phosphoribosyltransferase
MIFDLSATNSIANHFVLELRDKTIQQDRLRFRKNMERLGEIMAYEISKRLKYTKVTVETPLGKKETEVLLQQPVLITVLRAGLTYFQGFNNFFDRADCGFIGAYRKEEGENIKINLEYLATPGLDGRDVILVDPILATGKSFVRAANALKKNGTPAHIHFAALIAAPEGIKFIERNMSGSYSIATCVVDEKLDAQFYIVPGLGDAGDLCFGEKL